MKKAWPYIFISLLILFLDQWTKQLVLQHIEYGHSIKIFSFLNITMQVNAGAAFSFLGNSSGWQIYFLSAISAIVSLALIISLFKIARKNWMMALPLSLILGGALGNLIDRFRYSYVVDFVDFHIQTWHFATFNMADAAVSVGAVWLAARLLSK